MAAISTDLDTEILAKRYELLSDTQHEAGAFLLENLSIAPGERVLDIGCGTGRLASDAVGLVGLRGLVVGIDPLKDRIDIARMKAKFNLTFDVGDAQNLSRFAPASFDVVYLNAVFHWLPNQPESLLQCYRVLKEGGRLGISTISSDHPPPYQNIKTRVMSGEGYQKYPENGVEKFPTQNQLECMHHGAGFPRIEIAFKPTILITQDAGSMIDWAEASSFGNYLGHLPKELRATARDQIKQEFEKLRTDKGVAMEILRMVSIATKPIILQ